MFHAELHGDKNTQRSQEEERPEQRLPLLCFEYFAVTFIVVEYLGLDNLTPAIILVVVVGTLTVSVDERVNCLILLLFFFNVLVDLWLFAGEDD